MQHILRFSCDIVRKQCVNVKRNRMSIILLMLASDFYSLILITGETLSLWQFSLSFFFRLVRMVGIVSCNMSTIHLYQVLNKWFDFIFMFTWKATNYKHLSQSWWSILFKKNRLVQEMKFSGRKVCPVFKYFFNWKYDEGVDCHIEFV